MKEAEYPNILPDMNSKERSFVNICVKLAETKEKFKLREYPNFLELYPIFKKLFYCYTVYIKY